MRVTELRDECFALDDPAEGPDYNAGVRAVCAAAGFEPRGRELATHHDAWQNAILHDGCVGLTVRSAIHSGHQGLRLIALDPPATFPLDLLWRRGADERSPAIGAVLAAAADVARREHWLTGGG